MTSYPQELAPLKLPSSLAAESVLKHTTEWYSQAFNALWTLVRTTGKDMNLPTLPPFYFVPGKAHDTPGAVKLNSLDSNDMFHEVALAKPSDQPDSAALQRLAYVSQNLEAQQDAIQRHEETVSSTTETMGWQLIKLRENVLAQYGNIQDEIDKSWNEFPTLLRVIGEVPPARRAYRVNFLLKTLHTNYDAALEATVQTLEAIKQLAMKIKQMDPSGRSKTNSAGLPTPESVTSAEEKVEELQKHVPDLLDKSTVDKFILDAFRDPQDRRVEVVFNTDDADTGQAVIHTMDKLFDDPATRPERIVVPWSSVRSLLPGFLPPVWQALVEDAQDHHIDVMDPLNPFDYQDKDKKAFVFRGDGEVGYAYRYVVRSSPRGPGSGSEEGTIESLEPIQFNEQPVPGLSDKEKKAAQAQQTVWVRW